MPPEMLVTDIPCSWELAPDLVIEMSAVPSTQPSIPHVDGAVMDGGVQAGRRHLIVGLEPQPDGPLNEAWVTISTPRREGASLRTVAKSVIDGLDHFDVIRTDRSGIRVTARFDEGNAATWLSVHDDERCSDCPGTRCKRPSKYSDCCRYSGRSTTTATVLGTMPLVATSGEVVTRDVESYVRLLCEEWEALTSLTEAERRRLATILDAESLRMEIVVGSGDTADLDNVVGRVLDMLHVGSLICAGCPGTSAIWWHQPSIDDVVVELDYVRRKAEPEGVSIKLTVLDGREYLPSPQIDIAGSVILRRRPPLPQIEWVRRPGQPDVPVLRSPRLAKTKARRPSPTRPSVARA